MTCWHVIPLLVSLVNQPGEVLVKILMNEVNIGNMLLKDTEFYAVILYVEETVIPCYELAQVVWEPSKHLVQIIFTI